MADPFQGVTMAEMMGGMFGPNPYSNFPGRIPMPGYSGTPTDAQGNPIQQAPGTTLNSAPAAPPPAPASPQLINRIQLLKLAQQRQQQAGINPVTGMASDPQALQQARYYRQMLGAGAPPPYSGPSGSGRGYEGGGGPPQPSLFIDPFAGQSSGASASTATGGPGGSGSLDNALALLSNPGKVTTPGADVPGTSISSGPSVLQSFLASRQGGAGAGNYSNQGFFDTLNRLGAR